MAKISNLYAYEVIDSRGHPTVAAVVILDNGKSARAMVPSGASTGEREALEMRDGDKKRFNGKGVLKAVANVNSVIAPKLIGMAIEDQQKLDKLMIDLDGTPTKSKLGANAILAVSMALIKAAAKSADEHLFKYIAKQYGVARANILPLPMINVVNGGEHADNSLDFQEFMFMPIGAKTIAQAIQMGSECFHSLQKLLHDKGQNTAKGDEGGFAPNLKDADEVLTIMTSAAEKAGYKVGLDGDIAFALDPACSELYDDKSLYIFKKAIAHKVMTEAKAKFTTDKMIDYWTALVNKFPIVSIEDALSEKDWDGWVKFNEKLGNRLQIVGDDLYCTNPEITKKGIEKKASNSVLVKVNQIGSVTEAVETIKMAHQAGWTTVVSHRSGETEDTFIADLAVAMGSGQIKTGSMSRSERIAKYNRLLEIEQILGTEAVFLGKKAFKFNAK